jgi:hypothetical protein
VAIFLTGSTFGIEQHLQTDGVAKISGPDPIGRIHQVEKLVLGGVEDGQAFLPTWDCSRQHPVCQIIVRDHGCSPLLGMLKKAASGVLAPWPHSRTASYAPPVQVAAALLDEPF